MHTHNRVPWWPLDPRPEEVFIENIARGCATECRFNGQGGWYSVAQHAVLASRLCGGTGYELWALLHDAPEGMGLKDLPRPVKRHIGAAYKSAESLIMRAVCHRYQLEVRADADNHVLLPEPVHHADETLLATEARDLIGNGDLPRWDSLEGIVPLKARIRPWTWQKAERLFLERFAELAP